MTLAVRVAQQCNVRATVRVILNALYLCWNAVLDATEINHTVMLLVSTTDMTGSDVTVVVTTSGLRFLFDQRRERTTFVQVRVDHFNHATTAW